MNDQPRPSTTKQDADDACFCIVKLASECRLNPTAYLREGKEKVRKLERENIRFREALERIAREDGRPMSMRVSSCGEIAQEALTGEEE